MTQTQNLSQNQNQSKNVSWGLLQLEGAELASVPHELEYASKAAIMLLASCQVAAETKTSFGSTMQFRSSSTCSYITAPQLR